MNNIAEDSSAGGMSPPEPSSSNERRRRRPSRHQEFFNMIEQQDWVMMRSYLRTAHGAKCCMKPDSSGLSVLGMALGFHAPLDIIKTLLDIDPKASMKLDMFGAVPLHVACLNGASKDVIKYILDYDDSIAAYSVDDDQRAPLHHAVEHFCRPRGGAENENENENDSQQDEESSCDDDDTEADDEQIEVIQLLCDAAPKMVRYQDRHGDTPIDLSQLVKADAEDEYDINYIRGDRVYRVLRATLIQLYRKEKHEYESKRPKMSGGKDDRTVGTAGTSDSTVMSSSLASSRMSSPSQTGASAAKTLNSNASASVSAGVSAVSKAGKKGNSKSLSKRESSHKKNSTNSQEKAPKKKRFGLFKGKS